MVETKEKTEKNEIKPLKRLGEYGFARVHFFPEDFKQLGLTEEMTVGEANDQLRRILELPPRTRSRDETKTMLNEAFKKAKAEDKKAELQKLINKFLEQG